MSLSSFLPVPVISVNRYIWDTMKRIDPALDQEYGGIVPFFPLADSRGGDANWGDKPYIVYDITTRKRQNRFYPKHAIQIYYFIRGQAQDVIVWSNAIQHIIDREDDAAKDVNSFMADKHPDEANVYFHTFNSFMMDQVNDKRMDHAVQQFYTMSMIVEATYHLSSDNANFEFPYGRGSLYQSSKTKVSSSPAKTKPKKADEVKPKPVAKKQW